MNANQNSTDPQSSDSNSGPDLLDGFGRTLLQELRVWQTTFFGNAKPGDVFFRLLTVGGDSDPDARLGDLLDTATEVLGDTFANEIREFFQPAADSLNTDDSRGHAEKPTADRQHTHHVASHPIFGVTATPLCDEPHIDLPSQLASSATTGAGAKPTTIDPDPEIARLRTLLEFRTKERDAANAAVEALNKQLVDLGRRYNQSREWATSLETRLNDTNRALRQMRDQIDSGVIAAETRDLCTHGLRFRDNFLRRLGRATINDSAEFGQHPITGNLTISFAVGGLVLTYDCVKQRLWMNIGDGPVPVDFMLDVIETANTIINEQRAAEVNPTTDEDDCPDQPDLSAKPEVPASDVTADNRMTDQPHTVPSASSNFEQARVPGWDDIMAGVKRTLDNPTVKAGVFVARVLIQAADR